MRFITSPAIRHFLFFICLFLLFTACDPKHSPPQYNVLFIAIDDLRPELGCYGKAYVHSPHIDRLAAGGIRFDRAYCSVSWCSPSRTSLMTGLRPGSTGVIDLQTHFRAKLPDVVTLPQFFKQQGYTSLGFGKLYHNNRELQDSRSWTQPCWLPPMQHPILAYATNKNQKIAAASPYHKSDATEAAQAPDDAYPDGMVTQQAIAALRQMSRRGEPFFIGVGYYKPHMPFTAPQQYWDLYNPEEIPLAEKEELPEGAAPYIFREWSEPGSYRDIDREEPYTDSLSRHLKHGYLACVSFVDAQVGKLMEVLEESGLRQNTIVVLWGDHGWKLGEYGRWSKHSNMELDTRVPLILSIPGREPAEVEHIVETIDLYPTLLKLAGYEAPANLQGEDLFEKQRDYALSQIPRDSVMGYSIRTPEFRYTEWKTLPPSDSLIVTELYDHRENHDELYNLLPDKGFSSTVKRLRQKMDF